MAGREADAFQAIIGHHRELTDGVGSRVAALKNVVAAGESHQAAQADLVSYFADEILTHALAEEQSLYPAAAALSLAEQVEVMVAEHRRLESAVEALARATDGPDGAARAEALADDFATHVAAENDLILPALLASEEASLADLLAAMAKRYKAAKGAAYGDADDARAALADRLQH